MSNDNNNNNNNNVLLLLLLLLLLLPLLLLFLNAEIFSLKSYLVNFHNSANESQQSEEQDNFLILAHWKDLK